MMGIHYHMKKVALVSALYYVMGIHHTMKERSVVFIQVISVFFCVCSSPSVILGLEMLHTLVSRLHIALVCDVILGFVLGDCWTALLGDWQLALTMNSSVNESWNVMCYQFFLMFVVGPMEEVFGYIWGMLWVMAPVKQTYLTPLMLCRPEQKQV